MKRNLIPILSLVVMSLMFNATGAYAQSYVKADVPFAFNVGMAQLPAGTYQIRVVGQNEIMIQNGGSKAAALSSARLWSSPVAIAVMVVPGLKAVSLPATPR